MTTTATQQVAIDNALVPFENRVEIGKCNLRIDHAKTQKELTYQVFLDALALTTFYPAFLITTDIPEIYMHQFWFTINKHDSSYRFKIGKKDEEIVSFIKELGHKGDIKSVSDTVVDHMNQPWRTFASIINNKEVQETRFSFYEKNTCHRGRGIAFPAKKVLPPKKPLRKQSIRVQIQDTPGVPVSKKKAPAKAKRRKGIDLLAKCKSIDTSKGTDLKLKVSDVSKADSSESEYESWGDSDDEANVKEYDRIDKELYGDVNIRLIDAEQDDEDQEDEDMTNVAHVQDVKELKDVDNSTKVISIIKYEALNVVKEYLGSSLDDALHKSFNKSPKHKALYHALMESIVEDEEAVDKCVTEKLKKRKPDDADKDKGPSTRSDRGDLGENLGKTIKQPNDEAVPKNDWVIVVPMILPNLYLCKCHLKVNEWNGYGHLEEIIVKRADRQLYTFKECDFKRLHLNDIEYMLLLIVQNKLNNLDGNVVVHLEASLLIFARRNVI
nr:hypothetical protein [Tanacetum cinerariifolium]